MRKRLTKIPVISVTPQGRVKKEPRSNRIKEMNSLCRNLSLTNISSFELGVIQAINAFKNKLKK